MLVDKWLQHPRFPCNSPEIKKNKINNYFITGLQYGRKLAYFFLHKIGLLSQFVFELYLARLRTNRQLHSAKKNIGRSIIKKSEKKCFDT